jgi:GT2 family glycosyltransferase
MDDDCIPAPTALQELLEAAKEHPGFGFLSSKVIWTDGSRCCMNEQKLVSGSLDADTVQPCRQATFVSLLFSTKAVRQVGLPITDFFIWGDDVEYTRRMSSKFPCWYVPASVVLHKTANNAGSNVAKDSKERLSRYRYAYRNEVYIARSEGGSRILYQGAKVLYHIARVLAAAPDSKKERIAVIIEGTKEGLHFNPAVEKTI